MATMRWPRIATAPVADHAVFGVQGHQQGAEISVSTA
jgi:hypothetical protein